LNATAVAVGYRPTRQAGSRVFDLTSLLPTAVRAL
jgi:hypothetical protein